MNTNYFLLFLICGFLLAPFGSQAQGSDEYGKGLKVNLNSKGSSYFRLISWAQVQAKYDLQESTDANGNDNAQLNFNLRRARMLMYAQISKRFLILTHFGLNSLTANNMSPIGTGDRSQLFWHDVWAQYSITKDHAVGGGLHYWNGISRANNQSTLNMMPIDNNRQAWATIGLSDQFARHMGIYAKGFFDRFQYRVSVNDALTNNLQATATPTFGDAAVYSGRRMLGSKKAGKNFAGYFEYNFFDKESNFLPYKVGSYVGTKKVLNVGAGFFAHPNGAVVATDTNGGIAGENVSIFAADVFYDAPIGLMGSAITAYGLFQSNNYGKDYMLGTTYETGTMLHGQVGYLFAGQAKSKVKFQPYGTFTYRNIEALNDNATQVGIGANMYMSGHNSKISLEFNSLDHPSRTEPVSNVTLQAMIYL